MADPRATFAAAFSRVQQSRQAAVEKTSAPKKKAPLTAREKLSSVKIRNEEISELGARLQQLGERGVEKVAFARVPTNSFTPEGYSSRDVMMKISSSPAMYTPEGYDPFRVAAEMDVISPDDAFAVFAKTAARYGTDPVTLAQSMDIGHPDFVPQLRQFALTKVSEDDIAKAKDAVQAIVKAKGELPSAVDIADAANVSPLAANVAVHETAELIAAVGGEVASADIPMVQDPGMAGPEMMGAGEMPPPPMMGPPPGAPVDPNTGMPMDPNMAPPMDPNMAPPMDPNMAPPMDPNAMPPAAPPPGMEAQATLDDYALERALLKIAESMIVEDPSTEQLRETPPLEEPEFSVGGETAASTRKKDLDVFRGAKKGSDLGLANVAPEDENGTLELESAHLKSSSSKWSAALDSIFKGSEDEEPGEEGAPAEEAGPAETDEDEASQDTSDGAVEDWIKDYLKENSEYPTAEQVVSEFQISDDRAESLIEGLVEED